MNKKDDVNKEITEILKIIEPKKKFHLLQTNINEREDLSQEIDILILRKLHSQFENQPLNFYQYLKLNEEKKSDK